MKIRPLGDRIAITLRPGAGKIGALFIPDSTKSTRNQTFSRATVVGHGSKTKLVKTGDTVVVSEYFGDEVIVDGVTMRIGRERDIVGLQTLNKIKPVGDRVLVERVDPPKMFGLLHLPQDVRAQQFNAKVVAAGAECVVELGDTVMLPKAGSVEVRLDGKVYNLIDEPTILAVL